MEEDGAFYLIVYDEEQKKYLPDKSKQIPREELVLYANAVGKGEMPKVYNIEISNIKVTNADPRYPILLMGLTDAPIQNVSIKNIEVEYRGGMKMEHAIEQRQLNTNWKYVQYETKSSIQTLPWLVNTFFLKEEGLLPRVDWNQESKEWKDDPYNVPELPTVYPEPSNWGILPAYGLYARHVAGLKLSDIKLYYKVEDERHAIVLDDVNHVQICKLDAAVKEDVECIAIVTNHFKRHTNREYILNESYFTTRVESMQISEDVLIKEVIVNAPSPGTPKDRCYPYETLPIPQNGYTYKVPTDKYPLPQTVFRPFLAAMEEVIVRPKEELTLSLQIRYPAREAVMEEADSHIYNEELTQKEYVVKGIEKELKVYAENLPKGARFDGENYLLSWKPNINQVGDYEILIIIDDGFIKEKNKLSIKVKINK